MAQQEQPGRPVEPEPLGGRRDSPAPSRWSTDVHVHRWQAGDDSEFTALYERFAPLLAQRARRSRVWPLLQGHHALADVVQTIWARVLPAARKSFTPSGPGSFLAFLGTLADRTMVDEARRLRARKRGEGQEELSLDAATSTSTMRLPSLPSVETPTSRARCSELEELARRVLNEREHEAWDLVEIQGYSREEAGLALSCSPNAVRGLLFRARARLVQALKEEEPP